MTYEGRRDPERKKATNRAWYEANRQAAIDKAAAWRADNLEQAKRNARSLHLFKSYGITLDDYDAMLLAQGGVCAICAGPGGKYGLHVDHCHTTGKVRGLLCTKCNGALHYLENIAWREAAESYLRNQLDF